MKAEVNMEKLEIGCYAPDGEIETLEGKTVRLKNLMRKKTVLFFLRACVLCTDTGLSGQIKNTGEGF